jgi:aspartyl/glutamyl-tRNA(Asn/Gln) amidotransferase subunit A (EC 6.3.5.-)
MDEEVRDNFFKLVEVLSKAGFKVVEVPLPHLKYSVEVYQIIATSEASSNLARFDGIRYGFRKKAEDLEDLYNSTRSSGFGAEVKRRIAIGTFALSHGGGRCLLFKGVKSEKAN